MTEKGLIRLITKHKRFSTKVNNSVDLSRVIALTAIFKPHKTLVIAAEEQGISQHLMMQATQVHLSPTFRQLRVIKNLRPFGKIEETVGYDVVVITPMQFARNYRKVLKQNFQTVFILNKTSSINMLNKLLDYSTEVQNFYLLEVNDENN